MGDYYEKQYGGKADGELIRKDDWNAVVKALDSIATEVGGLQTGLGDTQKDVQDLGELLTQVKTNLESLKLTVDTVCGDYYQLTLETGDTYYAMGEAAEITARITGLSGQPVKLNATRPWVDFVATWGSLQAAAGYASTINEGGQSASVQFAADGTAKVRLHAGYAGKFTAQQSLALETIMQTKVEANKSAAQIIKTAASPVEAKNAFAYLSKQYDLSASSSLAKFADNYAGSVALYKPGNIHIGDAFTMWEKHTTTLMAFVRRDSDPRTPDPARGVSSIQIFFRDWIGPWIHHDYFTIDEGLINSFRDKFGSKITDDAVAAAKGIHQEIAEAAQDKGKLGRQKIFETMVSALDRINLPDPPPYTTRVLESAKDAIALQSVLEQSAGVRLSDTMAVKAFTTTAVSTDSGLSDVHAGLAQVGQTLGAVQKSMGDMQRGLSVLDEKTNTLGSTATRLHADVQTMRGQVTGLQKINAEAVSDAISKTSVLWSDRTRTG